MRSAMRVLWSILEISIDQHHQRVERSLRILSFRAKIDGRVLWRLRRHDLDDALGVDPGTVRRQPEIDPGFKCLGKLGQLDRGPGVQPDLVSHENRCPKLAHPRIPHQTGVSSSAVRRTTSSDAPEAASVAAITAPSTTGALQTTTRLRRSSGSISIAISLLVSAPPRSTRMATPFSDQALSIAAMIASTLVPSPPSGSPPHQPSGTSRPTICSTISAVPRATSAEWDTMTIPTFSLMQRLP